MMSCSSVYNSSNDFVCQYRCQIAACMPLKSDCVFLGGQRTSSFFFSSSDDDGGNSCNSRFVIHSKISSIDSRARFFFNFQTYKISTTMAAKRDTNKTNKKMILWRVIEGDFGRLCRFAGFFCKKKSMCFFHMLKSKVVQQQFNVKP